MIQLFSIPLLKKKYKKSRLAYIEHYDKSMNKQLHLIRYTSVRNLITNFNTLQFEELNTKKIFQKRKLAGLNGLLFSGNTLDSILQLENFVKKLLDINLPKFFFGCGVTNIRDNIKTIKALPQLLNDCKNVGVRGPDSKMLLNSQGFENVTIIGDPALSFSSDKIISKKGTKRIALNFGSLENFSYTEEHLVTFYSRLSKILLARGWDVTFFVTSKYELPTYLKTINNLNSNIHLFKSYNSLKKTVLFLTQECDIVFAENLSAAILACCTGTPVFLLDNQPKCLDFMKSMDMERFCIKKSNLSIDFSLTIIDQMCDNVEVYQEYIHKKCFYYKQLQIDFSKKILLM